MDTLNRRFTEMEAVGEKRETTLRRDMETGENKLREEMKAAEDKAMRDKLMEEKEKQKDEDKRRIASENSIAGMETKIQNLQLASQAVTKQLEGHIADISQHRTEIDTLNHNYAQSCRDSNEAVQTARTIREAQVRA